MIVHNYPELADRVESTSTGSQRDRFKTKEVDMVNTLLQTILMEKTYSSFKGEGERAMPTAQQKEKKMCESLKSGAYRQIECMPTNFTRPVLTRTSRYA